MKTYTGSLRLLTIGLIIATGAMALQTLSEHQRQVAAQHSLAEGGSDRLLEQRTKVAEGGSDRLLERREKVAEGGSDRLLEQRAKIAEGGSDRLLERRQQLFERPPTELASSANPQTLVG